MGLGRTQNYSGRPMFGTAGLYTSTVSQRRDSKPQQRDRGSLQSFSGDLRACLRHSPCLQLCHGRNRWVWTDGLCLRLGREGCSAEYASTRFSQLMSRLSVNPTICCIGWSCSESRYWFNAVDVRTEGTCVSDTGTYAVVVWTFCRSACRLESCRLHRHPKLREWSCLEERRMNTTTSKELVERTDCLSARMYAWRAKHTQLELERRHCTPLTPEPQWHKHTRHAFKATSPACSKRPAEQTHVRICPRESISSSARAAVRQVPRYGTAQRTVLSMVHASIVRT